MVQLRDKVIELSEPSYAVLSQNVVQHTHEFISSDLAALKEAGEQE